jgi:hypothetical protein
MITRSQCRNGLSAVTPIAIGFMSSPASADITVRNQGLLRSGGATHDLCALTKDVGSVMLSSSCLTDQCTKPGKSKGSPPNAYSSSSV